MHTSESKRMNEWMRQQLRSQQQQQQQNIDSKIEVQASGYGSTQSERYFIDAIACKNLSKMNWYTILYISNSQLNRNVHVYIS